jgi:hypothetical protein
MSGDSVDLTRSSLGSNKLALQYEMSHISWKSCCMYYAKLCICCPSFGPEYKDMLNTYIGGVICVYFSALS